MAFAYLRALTRAVRSTSELEPIGDDARSQAQLARLVGVDRSAITRALKSAQDAGRPLPPHTTDPATGRRAFPTTAFVAWWDGRPGPVRPRRS